jgi:hypothetical protein
MKKKEEQVDESLSSVFTENMTQEEKENLQKFLEYMNSDNYRGFSGCGHAHKDENGVLWNDAGHRTQIERAIWILASLEPGNEFLSLWSLKAFRDGFYLGLWQADYKNPWFNMLDFRPFVYRPTYTSHFFNPKNGKHFGHWAVYLNTMPRRVTDWGETAYSRVVSQHFEAAKLHDQWKEKPDDNKLSEMGRLLGLATHYFTDLTQPMHAANFTNGFGAEGSGDLDWNDLRHGNFEDLADDILNNPNHPNHASLIQDPAVTKTNFVDKLDQLLMDTANYSWNVFDQHIKIPIAKWKKDAFPPLNEALPAYQSAFPAGQIATAKFFQQWARQSHDQNPSLRLRSDLVATTVRRDASKDFQPAIFYRRDGDLRPVFRFLEQGQWLEDTSTFAEFGKNTTNAAAAFASCFDTKTDHPVLFIADDEGKLFYFDLQGGWKKTAIATPEKVRGSIVSLYDFHYDKPCALFRGESGLLHYVYWGDKGFVVSVLNMFPKVGGAIAAVWDPTDCGYSGKGHIAVSYIGGDGSVHHLDVRKGAWRHQLIKSTIKGGYADAQTLSSVYDIKEKTVGIFWGQVEHIKKEVPESNPKLYVMERQSPKITYSLLHTEVSTKLFDVKISGGIAAVGSPNAAVFYTSEDGGNMALERFGNNWMRHVFKGQSSGMKSAFVDPENGIIVGGRIKDRSIVVTRYRSPHIKSGDVIALKADNDKYFGRINRGAAEPIEAVKTTIDTHAKFQVQLLDTTTLSLKSDDGTGKYLGRINRGAINPIEAVKNTVDPHARFHFSFSVTGAMVLMADNGAYLKRDLSQLSSLLADSNRVDYYTLFTVSVIK